MGWFGFLLCVVLMVASTECDRRVQLAQQQPSAPRFGPGDNLADMYCAYCRQRGWWECIQRWCYQGQAGGFFGNMGGFYRGGAYRGGAGRNNMPWRMRYMYQRQSMPYMFRNNRRFQKTDS